MVVIRCKDNTLSPNQRFLFHFFTFRVRKVFKEEQKVYESSRLDNHEITGYLSEYLLPVPDKLHVPIVVDKLAYMPAEFVIL